MTAKRSNVWTRRTFSKGLLAFSQAHSLGWKSLAETVRSGPRPLGSFAYAASCLDEREGAIQAFSFSGSHWHPIQTVTAAAPAHLERHPALPVLYAVHAVGLWESLPRGAVSAYSIESSGHLQLLNTQPLPLSATFPRHATVTGDGKYLAVAAEGGGSYSLFPIAADGSLKEFASCRKEVGWLDGDIAKTSQPRHVLSPFGSTTLLTGDVGDESLHSFSTDDGSMRPLDRRRVHTGAGPSQIVLSDLGPWIYAVNAADGALSTHSWEQYSGQISACLQRVESPRQGATVLAMHQTGRFLVTAGAEDRSLTLASWSIDRLTGHLTLAAMAPQTDPTQTIMFSPCGQYLISSSKKASLILQSSFDVETGAIGRTRTLASVGSPSCVSFYQVSAHLSASRY